MHVCEGCGWVGETTNLVVEVHGGGIDIDRRCPECDNRGVHWEYFGNPLPDEDDELSGGGHKCPVCATNGTLVRDAPGCECGARFGSDRSFPERGEKDVIIRASDEDLRHKVFDYTDGTELGENPRQDLVYWRVSGTPQKTGPGRTIMFSTDGKTVDYYAPICTVEEGRILFDYLTIAPIAPAFDVPVEPPTRGFKYFEWGDYPW